MKPKKKGLSRDELRRLKRDAEALNRMWIALIHHSRPGDGVEQTLDRVLADRSALRSERDEAARNCSVMSKRNDDCRAEVAALKAQVEAHREIVVRARHLRECAVRAASAIESVKGAVNERHRDPLGVTAALVSAVETAQAVFKASGEFSAAYYDSTHAPGLTAEGGGERVGA